MKLTSLFIGLSLLSTAALADIATISSKGTSVELSGGGVTKEIFTALSDAHAEGFTDARGAKVFEQLSTPNRIGGRTDYVNKYLSASVRSGITLSYSASLSVKKGDAKIVNKILTITGKSAELLKGAMAYTLLTEENQPVGGGRSTTPSGKLSCKRVVVPRAPTICTLKL